MILLELGAGGGQLAWPLTGPPILTRCSGCGVEVVRVGYECRPVPAILQLASEAEARFEGAPPEALPAFFAGKAQALALAGRDAEAEQTLCQLWELPISSPHRDSFFDFAEGNLRFSESFVYSHAGDLAKAERAQEAALTLYRDGNLRDPEQIGMRRALCLVRMGDSAAGARHALDIITSLPAVHRIRPLVDLGQKVLGSIPARERSQAWEKKLRRVPRGVIPWLHDRRATK